MPEKSHQRFARPQRLLKAAEFRSVFAKPIRVGTAHLTVLAKPNHLAHARLGLAVAKRQVKLAVERNRIKRLVREGFRQHQQQLSGLDLVVMARTSAVNLSNRDLVTDLNQLWHRLIKKCEKSLSS